MKGELRDWHGVHCLCNASDLGGNRQHSSPNIGHQKLPIKLMASSMFLQTSSFTAREISHLNSNTCDCTILWHFSLSLPVSQQDVRIHNLPVYASWKISLGRENFNAWASFVLSNAAMCLQNLLSRCCLSWQVCPWIICDSSLLDGIWRMGAPYRITTFPINQHWR